MNSIKHWERDNTSIETFLLQSQEKIDSQLIFFVFLDMFFYCWHYYRHAPSPSLPFSTQPPDPRPLPHCCLCPGALHTCMYVLWLISSIPPSTPPLWDLSVCSMYPCFWFYFVRQPIFLWEQHYSVTKSDKNIAWKKLQTYLMNIDTKILNKIYQIVSNNTYKG